MAEITVNKLYNVKWIAEEAGTTDFSTQCYITDGDGESITLVVEDVVQTSLDSALTAYIPQHEALILPLAQEGANIAIDAEAGKVRKKYAPAAFGQSEIWHEKYQEAANYASAGYPVDASGYTLLQAEMNVTGSTAQECADDIITQRNGYIATLASIEEARRAGKIAVSASADAATAMNEMTNAITALQAL